MREVAERIELAGTLPEVNVLPEEYVRLLGYPRGWVMEGRARELADWARDWYAKNGRPWFYARQAEEFEIAGDSIRIDGVSFSSKRLKNTLEQADAHSVILVAVGAGIEAEEESHRLWKEEKPDEYFFLEMFGSAVVEHLTTLTGARLCDWAEQRGMAVLPHYSPGYPEWDVAEQPRLLELMKGTRGEAYLSGVEAFESGMLRPKKTLLAVFGLTRHTERLQRLTSLVPCERCSFGPCQYRRAPYRRAPRPAGEPLPVRNGVLDHDAQYSVNRKALQRWTEERLAIRELEDGSVERSVPLRWNHLHQHGPAAQVCLQREARSARAKVIRSREQRCAPADGDVGYESMCKFIEDPTALMTAIGSENPLNGERLNAVLKWRRGANAAGCFCEAASRDHKWGLVLETIHYALAQRELAQDTEP